MKSTLIALAFAAVPAVATAQAWDKDNGKAAPRLTAAGWVGTPVSLDALRKADGPDAGAAEGATVVAAAGNARGNTVVLAFWNADIAC
ncbi:MAG TPA: hypothetical protein VF950_30435 [Planctomycetota bacterium]